VLPVTVRVLSNEYEESPVSGQMARLLERRNLPGRVSQARVFLAPFTCQDSERNSILCEKEETVLNDITTRFYDIEISTKDAAGNEATKTCSVIVVPPNHYDGESSSSSKSKSSKGSGRTGLHNANDLRREYDRSNLRDVVAELELEYDPELDTTTLFLPFTDFDQDSGSCGCSPSQGKGGKGSKGSKSSKRGGRKLSRGSSRPKHG